MAWIDPTAPSSQDHTRRYYATGARPAPGRRGSTSPWPDASAWRSLSTDQIPQFSGMGAACGRSSTRRKSFGRRLDAPVEFAGQSGAPSPPLGWIGRAGWATARFISPWIGNASNRPRPTFPPAIHSTVTDALVCEPHAVPSLTRRDFISAVAIVMTRLRKPRSLWPRIRLRRTLSAIRHRRFKLLEYVIHVKMIYLRLPHPTPEETSPVRIYAAGEAD